MSIKYTPAERLMLWRRAHGWSEVMLAKRWGMSPWQVRTALKHGHVPKKDMATVSAYRPTPADRLYIARKRSGRTIEDIAADIGVSHVTLLKWEHSASPMLRKYWDV